MQAVCLIAGGEVNTGAKGNRQIGGNKGYIYLSSGNFIYILRLVG
jgi:hypothetical protein